jgi:putative transposase
LKGAIAAVLDGVTWQRCRAHFLRNLVATVPRHAQSMVASLVGTIFAQERPEDAWAQLERVVEQLERGKFTDAAGLLADAAPDILAYTAFPQDTWKKLWSNNPGSGSTANCAGEPTSSASSPTGPRSPAWAVSQQLILTRQGQVAERLTHAVDQLGHWPCHVLGH